MGMVIPLLNHSFADSFVLLYSRLFPDMDLEGFVPVPKFDELAIPKMKI